MAIIAAGDIPNFLYRVPFFLYFSGMCFVLLFLSFSFFYFLFVFVFHAFAGAL